MLLFPHIDPGGVAALRVASAAVALVLWRRPTWTRSRREWALLGGFGVALAGMNLTFYLAIDRIPVGTAVAIEFAGPVTVAALGSRRRRDWLALAAAAAGVVLLSGAHIGHDAGGVAFAALAGVLWASYIVLGHRVAARADATADGLDALASAMVVGAVAIAPVGIVSIAPALPDPALLAAAVGVGLMSSVVPYAIDQVTLRRMPRHRFALTLALLPATAAVVGSIVLGQLPTAVEAVGIALVTLSVALTSGALVPRGRREPPPTPS